MRQLPRPPQPRHVKHISRAHLSVACSKRYSYADVSNPHTPKHPLRGQANKSCACSNEPHVNRRGTTKQACTPLVATHSHTAAGQQLRRRCCMCMLQLCRPASCPALRSHTAALCTQGSSGPGACAVHHVPQSCCCRKPGRLLSPAVKPTWTAASSTCCSCTPAAAACAACCVQPAATATQPSGCGTPQQTQLHTHLHTQLQPQLPSCCCARAPAPHPLLQGALSTSRLRCRKGFCPPPAPCAAQHALRCPVLLSSLAVAPRRA